MTTTGGITDDRQPTKKLLTQKLFLSVMVMMITIATLSATHFQNIRANGPNSVTGDISRANSGPYRDGLYLGSLAAKQRKGFHISASRWSTEKDRGAFRDGYRAAFNTAASQIMENEAK